MLIQLIEDWDDLPLTVDAAPKDRPLYDEEDATRFWEEITTLTEDEVRQKEFENLSPEEQQEIYMDRLPED